MIKEAREKGSKAEYLPIWHIDLYEFLELRKPTGQDNLRAKELFYALVQCDLFMRRMCAEKTGTCFVRNKAKGLSDGFGEEFERLYLSYESDPPSGSKKVNARELYDYILTLSIELGQPYEIQRDNINRKNNQSNIGVVKQSNLCTEIVEVTSEQEIASCNLSSICLPMFVRLDKTFDYVKFKEIVSSVTDNLNQVIDRTYYPIEIPELRYANFKNRPIGIGVQGLADALILMDLSFEDHRAKEWNRKMFECMYYAFLKESMELAKMHGPYRSFHGSPLSKGLFHWDLWNQERGSFIIPPELPTSYAYASKVDIYSMYHRQEEWDLLRQNIMTFGVYNSLGIAPMPTAGSSHILDNSENFEPIHNLVFARTFIGGRQHLFINKYLQREMKKLGLWSTENVKTILSTQSLSFLATKHPRLAAKFKTVWEYSSRLLAEFAIDRTPFIDQAQSLNCFMTNPTVDRLRSYRTFGWVNGLKTTMYYLRSMAKVDPINYGLDSLTIRKRKRQECNDDETCLMCQS